MGYVAHRWQAIEYLDDVHISCARVNIYQGGFKNERDSATGFYSDVWKWRGRVDPHDEQVKAKTGSWKRRIDIGGNPQVVFTPADFGIITTEAELESFLDGQLDKLKDVMLEDDDKESLTFGQRIKMKIKPGQEK